MFAPEYPEEPAFELPDDMQAELEAYLQFFLTVYPEAMNALDWWQNTGMKPASTPRYGRGEAQRIVKAAQDAGLSVVWRNGEWWPVFKEPRGNAPALGGQGASASSEITKGENQ